MRERVDIVPSEYIHCSRELHWRYTVCVSACVVVAHVAGVSGRGELPLKTMLECCDGLLDELLFVVCKCVLRCVLVLYSVLSLMRSAGILR